jgi:hypothetical protein
MDRRSLIDRLTGLDYDVFKHKGHGYVLLKGPITWPKAQQKARKLGGDLVTINTPKENHFLTHTFAPLAKDDCGLWIGLKRPQGGGHFRWSNGSHANYRHWVPGGIPGYPQGMPSDDPRARFVHIYFNPNAKGYWKNADRTYHDVVISGAIAEFNF